MEGQSAFRPSDIAIMYDDTPDPGVLTYAINRMLKQEYNLETTSVRSHIINNNTDKVVFGAVEDCMSYEAPCVIFIDIGFREYPYRLLSRARTQLTCIYANSDYLHRGLLQRLGQHCTLVPWLEENGIYVKGEELFAHNPHYCI